VRLSDLLRSEVVDTNGRRYGTIEDVLIVQDGPLLLPFGAAFRVDRLTVGTRRVGTRLGYNRGGTRGPWLLRALFGASERRAHEIPWDAVVQWDGRSLLVRADAFDMS
jgi:sporulation protein YlmC with PRC-barrel domain